MWKKASLVLLFTIFVSIVSIQAKAVEISGDYERGERTYMEVEEIEEDIADREYEEEIVDYYYYDKLWLRLRQQLNSSDYYYIKVQYNAREYQEKTTFDHLAYDIWTNYTFRLSESVRNRLNFDFRNKSYFNNQDNTYNQYRMVYQLDYQYNDFHDYNLYVQRRWKDFAQRNDKNNVYDRVTLGWNWKAADNLSINSRVSFDREIFEPDSASSNKKGTKFNMGFKWKL